MKSSTSAPSSSRKYSAIVTPVCATRKRTPGGSSIWPKTSVVCASTPDSFISSPEIVAFARAFADAGEDREAFVHVGDVADQLLDEHRLADAGAAEESDLAAARVRRHQIDDFDARFEDARRRILILELGSRPVNRPHRGGFHRFVAVDRLAEHVENASQRAFAYRNQIGPPTAVTARAAHETVGRTHRQAADLIVTEFVLHLEREFARLHGGAAEIHRGVCAVLDACDRRSRAPAARR